MDAPWSGKKTPFEKEPPLGVAHTRLPWASMQEICVVPVALPVGPVLTLPCSGVCVLSDGASD